jgi:hypothetical protein
MIGLSDVVVIGPAAPRGPVVVDRVAWMPSVALTGPTSLGARPRFEVEAALVGGSP